MGELIIHDPQQERESTASTTNIISLCGEQSDEPASAARQVSPDTVTASIYSESAEPEDVEESSPISFTASTFAPCCASSCSCCVPPPYSQASQAAKEGYSKYWIVDMYISCDNSKSNDNCTQNWTYHFNTRRVVFDVLVAARLAKHLTLALCPCKPRI